MTRADIADYRRWHRRAALNARKAGFGIVCVYTAHDLSFLMHFLSPRHNQRRGEYGGDPFARECATLVLVTAPLADDALYHDLMADEAPGRTQGSVA